MEKIHILRTLYSHQPDGTRLEGSQAVLNMPASVLWPDIDFIEVDYHLMKADNTLKPETFGRDILVGSKRYRVTFCGSKSKKAKFMAHHPVDDFWVNDGPLDSVERSYAGNRAVTNAHPYGAGFGSLRVSVVESGTIWKGQQLYDGFGLISRELYEKIRNEDMELPGLGGRTRQSLYAWAWLDWPTIRDEMEPIIQASLRAAINSTARKDLHRHAQGADRYRLADEIETDMWQHPYIAKAYGAAYASQLFRLATTVDIERRYYWAIPGEWGFDGEAVVLRWPPTSPCSTSAVVGTASEEWLDYLENIEGVQYTISSKQVVAKGTLMIVEGPLPFGGDLVVTDDDVKLGKSLLPAGECHELDEAFLGFCSGYAKGSACSVPPSEWTIRSGDYDGDGIDVMLSPPASVFQAAKALGDIPASGKKVAKTRTLIAVDDCRHDHLHRCVMLGHTAVGWATNNLQMFLALAEDERDFIAHVCNKPDAAAAYAALGLNVSRAVDGPKTRSFKLAEYQSELAVWTKGLKEALGGRTPPWLWWNPEKPDRKPWAFRHGFPDLIYSDEEMEGWDQDRKDNAVWTRWTGTIAGVTRITLPVLQKKVELDEDVVTRPLSYFKQWAPQVSKGLYAEAWEIQRTWSARTRYVHVSNVEEWTSHVAWIRGVVREWAEERGITHTLAAWAVWQAAHSSRSNETLAALPFVAFPDETEAIIRDKPGLKLSAVKKAESFLLFGLPKQFETPPERLNLPVEVEEIAWGGQLRIVVCGNAPGQHPPEKEELPRDLIGFFDARGDQPQPGSYLAKIVKAGKGNAWHCRLAPRG